MKWWSLCVFFILVALTSCTRSFHAELESKAAALHRDSAAKYRKDIDELTNVIERDPNDADAYNARGNALAKLGQDKSAIADYTRAIKIDSAHAAAYYNRGVAKASIKEYASALDDYTKVTQLDPEDADAYYGRGNVYFNQEKYDAAIEEYTKAIAIEPEGQFYANRGVARDRLERYETAIADFNRAIKLDSLNAIAYYNRGLTRLTLHDLGGCDDLRKALELGEPDAQEAIDKNCRK